MLQRIFYSTVSLIIILGFMSILSSDVGDDIFAAARKFLDSLEDEAREHSVFPFDSPERFDWHYFPRSREGIPLKSMSAHQKAAAYELLQNSLSNQGYKKATGIIKLEDILRQIEGRGPNDSFRDPGKYYFTIFGQPDQSEPWGWRLEGHHLSLNFVMIDNQLVATTPAFLGANPAEIPFGADKGKRILKEEEDLARQLIKELNPMQSSQAIISPNAPLDIITRTKRKVDLASPEGISFRELSTDQQDLLMDLIKVYVLNNQNDYAKMQLKRIEKAGLEDLHFAWAGGLERGQKHYYRIHGPTLLIEYDNTQNNANHIHTVMRNLGNDFGEDALKRHYENSHHQ